MKINHTSSNQFFTVESIPADGFYLVGKNRDSSTLVFITNIEKLEAKYIVTGYTLNENYIVPYTVEHHQNSAKFFPCKIDSITVSNPYSFKRIR